jgi:multiple sugar transport system substrate-binding protein
MFNAARSATKTLTYAINGTPTYSAFWTAIADEFQKENPGVKLVQVAIPAASGANYVDTLKTRIASGLIPDIMQVATEGQYALAQTGVLEPINDYVAANKAYFDSYYNAVDKNFPAWLKLTTPPGPEQYYLPGEDQSMCMWLNRELFAAAGVALPSNDWTWDEFYAIAKRIKSKTGAYGYICDYGSYQGIEPWLLTNGTDQMSADWKTITMDTPAVAEAASFVRKLIVDGLAVPPTAGTFDDFAYQAKGKVAMVGCGRWAIIEMRQLGFVPHLDIVQFPINKRHGSPVGWNSYGVAASSKNKAVAFEFVKFCTTVKYNQIFARLGGTAIPARLAIADSSLFTEDAPAGTTNLVKALDYSTPIPSPIGGDAIENALQKGWLNIMTGAISVEGGLKQLQEQMSSLLERAQRGVS